MFHHGLFLYPRRQRAEDRQLALSAMDDAQACELDRSVWNLRLRGVRTLHHLVSGRHRHHGGSGGHQGDPASDKGRAAWRDLSIFFESILSSPALRPSTVSWLPGALETIASTQAPICFAKASQQTSSS